MSKIEWILDTTICNIYRLSRIIVKTRKGQYINSNSVSSK